MKHNNLRPSNNMLDDKQQILFDFESDMEKTNNSFSNKKYPDNYHLNKCLIIHNKDYDKIISERPICPKCYSKKHHKHSTRSRKITHPGFKEVKYRITRYKCTNCGKLYEPDYSEYISKYKQISNKIREEIIQLYACGHISVRNIINILKITQNIEISHQSVENIIFEEKTEVKRDSWTEYSGYYIYDEEWVKIKGEWFYRLVLYDPINEIVVKQKIENKINKETIKSFLEKSLKNKPQKAITTDLKREYSSIIESLGLKHQLCHFHFKQSINKQITPKIKILKNKIKRISHKIQKEENKSILKPNTTIINQLKKERTQINKQLKKLIKEKNKLLKLFNHKRSNIAHQQLMRLYNKKEVLEPIIKRTLIQKIFPNFKRITHWCENPKIERTSNKIENFFQKTFPKHVKRIMKTVQGIYHRINITTRNWEIKQEILKPKSS